MSNKSNTEAEPKPVYFGDAKATEKETTEVKPAKSHKRTGSYPSIGFSWTKEPANDREYSERLRIAATSMVLAKNTTIEIAVCDSPGRAKSMASHFSRIVKGLKSTGKGTAVIKAVGNKVQGTYYSKGMEPKGKA